MSELRFNVDLPYPKIRVERPDINCAKKLLSAYASKDSELTAITSYCYRSVIYDKTDPELSKIMAGIARIEMMHLNMLARLIYLLGYDPKYRTVENGRTNFWSGKNVSYKKNDIAVLKTAIAEEKGAYDGYIKLCAETTDPCVKEILTRLAADEKLHVQILTSELDKRMKRCGNCTCKT